MLLKVNVKGSQIIKKEIKNKLKKKLIKNLNLTIINFV